MTQIQQSNNPAYNLQQGTPLYNYGAAPIPQQQTVAISTPPQAQIYNYPQSSIYGQPSKQAASGVNIYIYNPSALGGPTSNSTANATYTMPGATQEIKDNSAAAPIAQAPIAQAPLQQQTQQPQMMMEQATQQPNNNSNESITIANSPIKNNSNENSSANEKKKKNIIEITNDYVKTLESYLRSPDKSVRRNGISELIKRFEEDDSRYDEPALNALLNIALQDPEAQNRMLALSVIAGGNAHGDNNTLRLVDNCEKSQEIYGQEAAMASQAKLAMAGNRITVDK